MVLGLSVGGWNDVNYSCSEQNNVSNYSLLFNFSKNVTFAGSEELDFYAIDNSQNNLTISLNGDTLDLSEIASWVFMDSTTGILIINSTKDITTGLFKIPLAVTSKDTTESGTTFRKLYTFIINATNDAPVWINSLSLLNFPLEDGEQDFFLNVTDEENNFPINFSIEWNGCYHAPWTGKDSDKECDLFNITNSSKNTGNISFSPTNDMVGEYNATINIKEGGNHTCPHEYCASNYTDNITVSYPLRVNVLSQLTVNTSNCSNSVFLEGRKQNCTIYVRTQGRQDRVNMSTLLSFANPLAGVKIPNNRTWFLPKTQITSYDNEYYYNITLEPGKSQIGNWSVNLTIEDIDTQEPKQTNTFFLNILRDSTLNSVPSIDVLPTKLIDGNNKLTIASNVFTSISFKVSDNDFLIEDKWDGYNETIELDLNFKKDGADVTFENWNYSVKYPVYNNANISDRNISTVNIKFFPNSTDIGNYVVLAEFKDKDGANDSYEFNLSIINDTVPQWKYDTYNFSWVVNSTQETTWNNITNLNLSNQTDYAFDYDILNSIHDDELKFNIYGDKGVNYPLHFNLTESGLLNFIPWKQDVSEELVTGNWSFIVEVCDKYEKCSNSTWIFRITNINSPPRISNLTNEFLVSMPSSVNPLGSHNYFVNQSEIVNITMRVYDDDLLVPNKYEKLIVNDTVVNLTAVTKKLDLNFTENNSVDNYTDYVTTFYTDYDYVGNYTITLEANDSFYSDEFIFNFTILRRNELPKLINITNISASVLDEDFYYDFNASDREDSEEELELNYTLVLLDYLGMDMELNDPENFNSTTGVLHVNLSNYSGTWRCGIKVNDSDSGEDYEEFYLYVYGYPNVSIPLQTEIFNFDEGSDDNYNFTVDYGVNNSNLTYVLSMNNIKAIRRNPDTCNDSEICYFENNYTIRNIVNFTMDDFKKNVSIPIPVKYYDENYCNLEGMCSKEVHFNLSIFNDNYSEIVSNFSWVAKINHTNENITFIKRIPDMVDNTHTLITLNLSKYFSDYDFFDEYYLQYVNFSINNGQYSPDIRDMVRSEYTMKDDWVIDFTFETPGTYNISVSGFEWDLFSGFVPTGFSNDTSLINSAESNYFLITVIDPVVITTPTTGGSGTSTKKEENAQHYGLKIIAPEDIVISDENYVELNFSVLNTGNVDLYGINLSGIVELGSVYSGDLNLTLNENWIDELYIGEMKNYSLRIDVNTGAVGKYLITIFGNVTKPKFSDWGEFYIEILAMDESDLATLLIFTEKLISENPECLELKEYVDQANEYMDNGDLYEAQELIVKVVEACQDAISKNDQYKFSFESPNTPIKLAIYIITSILVFGVVLFIVYLNRRVKFKKTNNDEYI